MSRDVVFAFTEGYSDRYAYSRIVGDVCRQHGISATTINADEIPDSGGGKVALLTFFDYAKRHDLLAGRFKGKLTVSLFFLDKDLDNVRRTQRRSPHINYTSTYELENLLFLNADLPNAVAAAAMIDPSSFGDEFTDQCAWCARAAAVWQHWVTLCAFSVLKAQNARGFYRRLTSRINASPYVATNHAGFVNELRMFEEDWDDSNIPFDRAFVSVEAQVQRAYDEGRADEFFKGTWYANFAYEDVRRLAGRRRWNSHGFHDRVICCLAMTLKHDCQWGQALRQHIDELLRAPLNRS